MLQITGNALQQVEKFQYLAVVFRSYGRHDKEIDAQIAKANLVLRELYRSVAPQSCRFPNQPLFRSSPIVTNVG